MVRRVAGAQGHGGVTVHGRQGAPQAVAVPLDVLVPSLGPVVAVAREEEEPGLALPVEPLATRPVGEGGVVACTGAAAALTRGVDGRVRAASAGET